MSDISAIENQKPLSHGMSKGLTFMFAVASGAAVGNLYWAQPLLTKIAEAMNVPQASAGMLVTVTQVGYALGILMIVPLGDTLDRRRLVPAIFLLSALALAASAFAPNFSVLLLALTSVGLSSVAGQVLVPLAGDLASPEQRGHVVGTVASGLLTGILASRTLSGLLSDAFGWRAIYILASIVAVLMSLFLRQVLPALPARTSVPYPKLLRSVFSVVREYKVVRVTLLLGAFVFSVFTMFWTALTFLLSSPPFSYSTTKIGLVGLVGLAGAVAAQRAGRFHDRGWSVPTTGAAILLALVSLAVSAIGHNSITLILIAVLLIDIAIQTVNVLNQTRLFAVDPSARSRLNTAFVTCNFIGGAIGSTLASVLWKQGGWFAVMGGGSVLIAVALCIWFCFFQRLPSLPNRV